MSKTASSKSSLFSKRLREARLRFGIPQDKLGVMIGLDESCSSARMSRYESGVHEPAFKTIEQIASALNLPTAYFFCEDDRLATIICSYQSVSEGYKQEIADFAKDLIDKMPK
jgi:transcriptional regulator with XRE-family HTH domain